MIYFKQKTHSFPSLCLFLQARELFDLAFVEQTSVLMILYPFYKSTSQDPPAITDAKMEKLQLRVWLGVEDALKLVDKWQLDGFADRDAE